MKKERYFIRLSYKGSMYHGWQVQPGKQTIQSTLEESMSVILQENIDLTGAGRTDSGVHAKNFIAHFDYYSERLEDIDNIVFRINCHLPKDIVIHEILKVKPDSHARFDALSRTYKYKITTTKDPFNFDESWHISEELDIERMNLSVRYLFDYKDFTSFSKLHTDVKTNNCRIDYANWERLENSCIFTITADRFLRNMVRAIVGSLVEIGTGKKDIEYFRKIIEAKDRSKAGKSVPAQGLFLSKIEYSPEIFV